ncbi:hypothetical protein [Halobellus sp. EA9]|uniref:hypothetical protein n=1 Tax=Halobellus sp. EA9 TaxID=3421647 RepID=UPI003EB99E30
MSDDYRDQSSSPNATGAFEDWMEQLAAETDLSTEEAFEQLVSAYWTLNEIFGLVERVGSESTLFRRAESGDRNAEPTPERSRPRDAERTIHRGTNDRGTEEPSGPDADALRAELSHLQARLSDVEAALAAAQSDSREEVTALAEQFDAARTADRSRLDSLDAHVNTEFGNSRTVLRRLIESQHGHDDALAAVRSELAALGDHVEAEAALGELKERANRLGVERADCEACGSTVRLALLSTPACPHCAEPFDGIEPHAGWWFGSDVLTVASGGEGAEADEQRPREDPKRKTVLPELPPDAE